MPISYNAPDQRALLPDWRPYPAGRVPPARPSAKGSPEAALACAGPQCARRRVPGATGGQLAFGAFAVSFSRIRADLPERSRR